jgi:hypothetical protein
MTSLLSMATGWQRHLRALFRVLAATLALAVTLGAVPERPEVVVILGPPPAAAASVENTRAPATPRVEAPRRRRASTHASVVRFASHALHGGRLVRLDPPGLPPHRSGPPVYLAHLRILC